MVDVDENQVFAALGTCISSILPDVQVFRGQTNRVPMPKGAFVIMTPVNSQRLATTQNRYTDTDELQTQHIKSRMRITIQLDFYGAQSAGNAQTVINVLNNGYAFAMFGERIKPLDAGEPMQIPLISAEKQYVARWKVDVRLQYNPVVNMPQQFFDKAVTDVVTI